MMRVKRSGQSMGTQVVVTIHGHSNRYGLLVIGTSRYHLQ